MDKLIIQGGHELHGEVQIAGAKNAALPLMAASVLVHGTTELSNIPRLVDVRTMGRVLENLGLVIERDEDAGRLSLNATNLNSDTAPYELVKTMRASFYALGALIGRLGKAKVSLPGGCAWGPRPVDIHLKGLEAMGVTIDLDEGYVIADASRIHGAHFVLSFPSVGATVNLLLVAATIPEETVLDNVAREPEVTALVRMLQQMGATIEGTGSSTLRIVGTRDLKPIKQKVIADRIEAGTYLAAVGMAGGEITLKGAEPEHLTMVIAKAVEAGLHITVTAEGIRVRRNGELRPVDVETAVYPGFATDMQAQWIALMSVANGSSFVTDTIYTDRFTHVAELIRLGAKVTMKENVAKIQGPATLKGAPVMSTDLRASACLVLAGLAAKGETHISRIYHLDRGYERLEEKLRNVGAVIERQSE
ncbi:UDP-N-acetylglucosamine 1-carboxyvinyltransferase [bacterium BMS3Bbin04]|nr:UDP-N-acetylglucosamine 1-carboxyvinyltransferase [bacterium BMS3Bbin04]